VHNKSNNTISEKVTINIDINDTPDNIKEKKSDDKGKKVVFGSSIIDQLRRGEITDDTNDIEMDNTEDENYDPYAENFSFAPINTEIQNYKQKKMMSLV